MMADKGKVVTWQAPGGATLNISPPCERRMSAAGEWPRDSRGSEYATVSHGLHQGRCECPRCAPVATMQDVRTVRGVAAEIDEEIDVCLEDGQIILCGHGVTEWYDTAEEAIAGLRASWAVQS